MKVIVAIAIVVSLFSCQKAEKTCRCHKEIWVYSPTQGKYNLIYKDSTNTYLDFCANHGAIEHQLNGNQEVTVCK